MNECVFSLINKDGSGSMVIGHYNFIVNIFKILITLFFIIIKCIIIINNYIYIYIYIYIMYTIYQTYNIIIDVWVWEI